ncbi:MAG: hypothetical protein LBJ59_02300 [Zoogloeaceae bacterium]|nr:hypothetical protein [Zoogloeaceae bacterium]
MKLKLIVDRKEFTAVMSDNAAARNFVSLLPLTLNMSDLNGNEKYQDIPNSLPTAAFHPETIHNGDMMLYGSRTLVLSYKTFPTPYHYTRLGSTDNPQELEAALGAGSVPITFTSIRHSSEKESK